MPTLLESVELGTMVELGKVEYDKVSSLYEGRPVEVLRKLTVKVDEKKYIVSQLQQRKAILLAELSEIDALLVEATKAGIEE